MSRNCIIAFFPILALSVGVAKAAQLFAHTLYVVDAPQSFFALGLGLVGLLVFGRRPRQRI